MINSPKERLRAMHEGIHWRKSFNSLRDALSQGQWGTQWAIFFLKKSIPKTFFIPMQGELISPFEATCYYGNTQALDVILKKASGTNIPYEQINKSFSHALWRDHSDILVLLLDHFYYTFDEAEYTKIKTLMTRYAPLREKINAINGEDLGLAKSLALLFPDLNQYKDVTHYMCQFLPVLHEQRGPGIFNALKSFNTQNIDPAHLEKLQNFEVQQQLNTSLENLDLEGPRHKRIKILAKL